MRFIFEHEDELTSDAIKLVIMTNHQTVAIKTRIDIGVFVGAAAALLLLVLLIAGG